MSPAEEAGEAVSDQLLLLRQILSGIEAIRQQLGAARKEFYTTEEVARATGRSEYTIRRWIAKDRLKAIRVEGTGPRGRLLVPRAAFQTLIAAGKGEAIPAAVVERFDGLRDLAPAAMVERHAEVIGPAPAIPAPSVDTHPPKKEAAGPSRATTIRASGPNDARDAFVYENYDKMTEKELRALLGKQEHWRQVKHDRQIHLIALRYASRHNLPVKKKSGRSPLHQVSSSET
jgi:excisionase family DNA binding protein